MMLGGTIIEVGEADFEARVLEASKRVPVVVDFWAAWCRPCLILGPALERLADEYGDRFVLAKVDVDANPALASAFGIQGIPAVKAFRDGAVVAEFVGAQPEPVVRRFLDEVAPAELPSLALARAAESEGRAPEAERLYREALAEDPRREEAAVGLARLLLGRGDDAEARALLSPVTGDGEARPLRAELTLRDIANRPGGAAAAARAALGGDNGMALEWCLDEIAGGGAARDEARETMLAIFDRLGDEDPLTRAYRPRLASALF